MNKILGPKHLKYDTFVKSPPTIVCNPETGDVSVVEKGKLFRLTLETAPLAIRHPKLSLEGNFADGSEYAEATRRDAQFTYEAGMGSLDEATAATDTMIIPNQVATFRADDYVVRAVLTSVFEQLHPVAYENEAKDERVQACEKKALQIMAAAYAAKKGMTRDESKKFGPEQMLEVIATDAELQAEFTESALEEFIDGRAYPTSVAGDDFNTTDGMLKKRDAKGRLKLAKLSSFRRKVYAWKEEHKGKKKAEMPAGPTSVELPSTVDNWPAIQEAMSKTYMYQPFAVHSISKKMVPKKLDRVAPGAPQYDNPTWMPIKKSRLTLAIIKYTYNYWVKAGEWGVSRRPLGELHIYRQIKNPFADKSIEMDDNATGAMSDSEDEAEPPKVESVSEDDQPKKRRKLPELPASVSDDEFST